MANEVAKKSVLTVSPPPHWHCGKTVNGVMVDFLIALLPAMVMAVTYYGFDALRVMALAIVAAVITETLCLKAMKRDICVDDFSAVITGLYLAFLLPASAPWWLVIMGAVISIALGKMSFGGLGANPMCAPLVGWAALRISWPGHLNIDSSMLTSPLTNYLTQLKYMGAATVSDVSFIDLLIGNQLGALGAVQVIGLLAGGIYLLVRGHISFEIPAAFLAGVLAFSALFYTLDCAAYANPLFHLLTGSVVFGAFFLATDYSSSPVGKVPMLVFGLFAGAMVIIIRVYGVYPDGVPFAILLANLITPLVDLIRPKPFGAR